MKRILLSFIICCTALKVGAQRIPSEYSIRLQASRGQVPVSPFIIQVVMQRGIGQLLAVRLLVPVR